MKKDQIFIKAALILSIIIFYSFGTYHLAKFETVDEHFWKEIRISRYWQALKNQNLEETYINDKPGVTVALISGIGLIFRPAPKDNQTLSASESDTPELFINNYDVEKAQEINFSFRLPILIFATLSLFLFFWLALSAFESLWTALLATMLVAFNPILVGMSQIINPDSFFWIFGGLSAISYLALLKTKQKKFLFICGALTGMALLSKYTAFMLFLLYFLLAISKIIFQKPENAESTDWKFIWKYAFDIAIIFFISIATFSVLLPAVFLKPSYLFAGIFQFFNTKIVFLLFAALIFFGFMAFFKRNAAGKLVRILSSKKHFFLGVICVAFSLLMIISFVNVWTGQKIVPVEGLRDAAYANEPKEFAFKPLIEKNTPFLQKNSQLFMMESYPLIFSLSPLIIFLILFISAKSFTKKISDENAAIIFSILSFSLIYLVSTIFAKVVTNARYLIVLYPLFSILGAVIITELSKNIQVKKEKFFIASSFAIIIFGTASLWLLRPFYFSYTNSLLPKEFSIHDSWGHGSFEAAQYLNALPEAEYKIIWSDSDTVCRFFEGKCLESKKIDLAKVIPDYFVISRRGELKTRNRFVLLNSPSPEKDSSYYFKKLKNDYIWQILINDRPNNFIKIIEFEK